MSVGTALAKNSALQIAGRVFSTGLGLITFYLLLHFFGTDGFGMFTTGMTYVTIFAIIVDLGITLTTTQMISEEGADEAKLLGNLVMLRTLTAIVFMSLCPLTALFIPQSEGIMDIIVLGSITYFISAIAQMFQGVFQKRLAIKTVVIAETANRTITIAGILITGLSGGTLIGAVYAFLVGIAVQLFIVVIATNKRVPFRPQIDLVVWKDILRRSWPIGISILFNLLYLRGDIFFMWIYRLPAADIGQYGSAYKVVDVVTNIPVTLMGLLLPLLTLAWSQHNREQFHKYLQTGFDTLAMIAVPFAFGSIALGVPLMVAVKSDLTLAGQILMILGPAVAILCFGSLYGHAVVAVQKQRIMTFAYAFVAILSVSAYMYFIPRFGAWAAAWITLASETLITILAYVVVTKASNMQVRLTVFWRALIASIAMVASIFILPWPHVAISFSVAVAVYVLVLGAIGGPKPKDLIALLQTK
jgi:O-antigen/teichoic acid export membrane protein